MEVVNAINSASASYGTHGNYLEKKINTKASKSAPTYFRTFTFPG